jgi:hypothetical protein
MPETEAVTANFRIAPTAMRKMEVPMPMNPVYPASMIPMQSVSILSLARHGLRR